MAKRILIIDDEDVVRKSFQLALEDSDYVTDTADCGEKGVAMFRKEPYDLVFLDLRMPGIGGVVALRELRKLDADVPIYIITAFYQAFLEELKSVEADGIAFDLLQKPIETDRIVLMAKSVLTGPVGFGDDV